MKKRTKKPKSKRTSQTLTQPDKTGLRVFDVVAAKMVGRILAEETDGIVLEWPAVVSMQIRPGENNTFKSVVRFDPVLFAERYKLMRTAIRGESYVYEPAVIEGYERYAALAEKGRFDLKPVTTPLPEIELATSPEEAPEATVAEEKLPGAGDAPANGQ